MKDPITEIKNTLDGINSKPEEAKKYQQCGGQKNGKQSN